MRGGTIFAGVVLIAGLGGCHLLFGHAPGSGSEAGDGRPRDGISGEGRLGDGLAVDSAFTDGVTRRDIFAAEMPSRDAAQVLDSSVCPPTFWCPDAKQDPTINATLYDVHGVNDASIVYAVGQDVVLRSTVSQRVWQTVTGLPSNVTWRGVHVLSETDAIVVGNGSANAVAYRLSTKNGATKLGVDGGSSSHTLNAVWRAANGTGYVVTTSSLNGGQIALVGGSGIASGPSCGKPLFGVDGIGAEIWVTGSGGAVGTLDLGTWHWNYIAGAPTLRGAVAISGDILCTVGADGAAGYVACCDYLFFTVDCPFAKTKTQFPPLRDITRVGFTTLVAVGNGVILSGSFDKMTLEVVFGKEANSGGTLHGVWAAVTPVGGKYDAWAVGEGGTILHRQY